MISKIITQIKKIPFFLSLSLTIKKHKIISVIALLLIVGIGYWSFSKIFSEGGVVRYVSAQVQKGTLIISLSGSGQVSALQQIDVKPEVSGKITYVSVKTGQKVYKGQALAYIDSKDAQKAVRDAQVNLESAQIALEKLRNSQQNNIETTTDNLSQAYRDAYNRVSDAFLDLPNFVELARSILYDNEQIDSNIYNNNITAYSNLADGDFRSDFKTIIDRAENDYKTAKNAFDPNFQTYRSIRLDASREEIVSILESTKNTVALIAQAIKSEQNMLDALVSNINDNAAKQGRKAQIHSQITAYQTSIGTTLSKLNSITSNLESAYRSIESSKRSIEDYELTNPIDIKSQENTVSQREATLADAKENLSKYAITAPFAGVIAKSDIKIGDSASQSTTIATLLTEQSIVQVSLNEVDVAKVKVGQKATLIFDAISDLTITGQVAEIDTIGTASQGVVTYNAKIAFDTQDERIKPSMSVSAVIITDAKPNVLLAPNSAIKSQGGISYVEIVEGDDRNTALAASISGAILKNSPLQKQVEVGSASDELTEILSGLNEGDVIVTRTIQSTAQSAQTQQNSSVKIPGLPSGGNTRTGGGQFQIFTR